MNLSIRPLSSADLPRACELSTQAGWNQSLADWRRTLRLAGEGLLGGWAEGKLVATASVATYSSGPSWLGMVLVDLACRRQGFGREMMLAALDLARARSGDAVGLDASDFGRPLYLTLGFHDVAPICRWSGVVTATAPRFEPSIQTVRGEALCDEQINQIAQFDQLRIGCDRSLLLRELAKQMGSLAIFVEREANLSGYALLRSGRLAGHLGPVVADSPEIAAQLVFTASRHLAGQPLLCDAFAHADFTPSLEQIGLSLSRHLTRMTLARPQPLLLAASVSAAVSFEYG
jgi:GNAT superfamily N-acetyltransferase